MKFKKILILVLFLLTLIVNAQSFKGAIIQDKGINVTVKVDERIELFSIIARLAEFQEYSNTPLVYYANNIDKHFKKYKNHSLIKYLKLLREENGLGYDAVMTMAVHLSSAPELKPRVNLTKEILDDRWGDIKKINDFLVLLRQFYKDARCSQFFGSQEKLYQIAEKRFQDLLNEIDFDWYKRFYRELPDGKFNLFIRLHSKGNYGPYVELPNGKRNVYAILSTTKADDKNLPVYDMRRLGTIIHEFNHSFINHLFWPIANEFKNSAKIIFSNIEEKLKKIGYGNWESVILESLANAAEVVYLIEQESDSDLGSKNLNSDRNRGFIWLDELVNIMRAYQNNEKMYPTFSSFFPFFIGYFNDLSSRFEKEVEFFEHMSVRVVDISPFNNNSDKVDPNIHKIKIVFNLPVDDKLEIQLKKQPGKESSHPVVSVGDLNENATELILNVKLEANRQYEFPLSIMRINTKNGYPLKDYIIRFKTSNE